jgi:hypothetical protein
MPREPMKRRYLVNVFLVLFLSAVVIDTVPPVSPLHQRLKDAIDPVLDATGLWQESWQLFAPQVDRINVMVSAKIRYDDGTSVTWRSPDWLKMSIWQRVIGFRDMELIDNIRLDKNRAAWASFADYLAGTVAHPSNPGAMPVEVKLVRHWAYVPRPEAGIAPFGERLPYEGRYLFYTREYDR